MFETIFYLFILAKTANWLVVWVFDIPKLLCKVISFISILSTVSSSLLNWFMIVDVLKFLELGNVKVSKNKWL